MQKLYSSGISRPHLTQTVGDPTASLRALWGPAFGLGASAGDGANASYAKRPPSHNRVNTPITAAKTTKVVMIGSLSNSPAAIVRLGRVGEDYPSTRHTIRRSPSAQVCSVG